MAKCQSTVMRSYPFSTDQFVDEYKHDAQASEFRRSGSHLARTMIGHSDLLVVRQEPDLQNWVVGQFEFSAVGGWGWSLYEAPGS